MTGLKTTRTGAGYLRRRTEVAAARSRIKRFCLLGRTKEAVGIASVSLDIFESLSSRDARLNRKKIAGKGKKRVPAQLFPVKEFVT